MLKTLLLAIFALPLALHAQSYLNNTSQWRYLGGSSGFDGTGEYLDHRFYFDGDTSISGKTYFKLYYDRQDTIINWINGTIIGYDTTLHSYWGAMREESKRFYMVYFYNDQEELIQDYNMQVGDTLQWDVCYYPVVVSGMDTIYLGPTPLKRFFLNGFAYEYVIEGACGTSGFKVDCPGAIGIEYNLDPVCYSRDGYTVSFASGNQECNLGASGTQTPGIKSLRFSPNPTAGLLRLDLPDNGARPSIQIFNAFGKRMPLAGPGDGTVLDLSAFPNGLYHIVVTTADGNYAGKVILVK